MEQNYHDYRNQGNKATGKRNCYQKVIICAPSSGEPYLCLSLLGTK